eukprot:2989898-Prymnesium_polylepis.1
MPKTMATSGASPSLTTPVSVGRRSTRHSKGTDAPVEEPVKAEPAVAAAEEAAENPDGLSAYELERRANIERNNALLAELDLLGASSALREASG